MPAFDFMNGDAYVTNAFGCEIDGKAIVVKEVSGLKQEFDMVEVKSQSVTGQYQLVKIPGRQKPVTITITRPLTDDPVFEDWMKLITKGVPARKDVTIKVFSPKDGSTVKEYHVKDCQPASLEVTAPQAGGTAPLEEKCTLHGVSMVIGTG
jgi:phage tail-like protein